MRTVAERLVAVRKTLGLTQPVFAERFGMKHRTYQRYEQGETQPRAEDLQGLAAVGVDVNWVLTGKGGLWVEGAGPPPTESDAQHSIVYIYNLRLAAGPGAIAFDPDQEVGRLEAPTVWLQRHVGISPVDTAALYVTGDSMRPAIGDGDLVVIDRHAPEVSDQVYAIRLVDELMVKRVVKLPGGYVRLLSDNPVFPPIDLSPEQAADLVVLGGVRAVFKRV